MERRRTIIRFGGSRGGHLSLLLLPLAFITFLEVAAYFWRLLAKETQASFFFSFCLKCIYLTLLRLFYFTLGMNGAFFFLSRWGHFLVSGYGRTDGWDMSHRSNKTHIFHFITQLNWLNTTDTHTHTHRQTDRHTSP